MSDQDLDKYLRGLGISTKEEKDEPRVEPIAEEEETIEFAQAPVVPVEGDVRERLESFLVNLLLNFDPAYAVEIGSVSEDQIDVDIFGGDPGKIIGRQGRTLAALEFLTNTVINQGDTRVRVNIDVGGYKRRRDERLRQEARRAAAKAKKTGFAVEFDPMSAAERRVIHMALADEPGVMSESTGEGKSRRVVVKLSD